MEAPRASPMPNFVKLFVLILFSNLVLVEQGPDLGEGGLLLG